MVIHLLHKMWVGLIIIFRRKLRYVNMRIIYVIIKCYVRITWVLINRENGGRGLIVIVSRQQG